MKIQITTIFFLLLAINSLTSQTIINNYAYPFDDSTLDGWQSTPITTNGEWSWSQNGKADDSPYWNDRDSINSTSLGGAVIFNAAKINGLDNPGVNASGAIESPFLDFVGETTVYLRFHQYYRNYGAITKIQYAQDGADWQDIMTPINQGVSQNVETGTADYQVIDISDEVGDLQNMKIRFVFEGDYYFWILDDIEFYNGQPYPETFPAYIGDSLAGFGYQYEIDENKTPYVANQFVAQFKSTTTPQQKDSIRDYFGAIRIDSCVCNKLELWEMGDDVFSGGDTLSGDGGTIGIQERIKGSKTSAGLNDVDFNYYNHSQLKDTTNIANIPFNSNPLGPDATSDTAILIAILDTGIDFNHSQLREHIYRNNDESEQANEMDTDENCLIDDWIGWNYVDKNNNPNDDHSHGTHVAGIVVANMTANNMDNCSYKLIPYKTHDFHGFATLFNVTCGTYQAQVEGASVINDSWGFYGTPSNILKNAIDTAKLNNITIVTTAGNDTIDLSNDPQYPGCYTYAGNIITVGAYQDGPNGIELAEFSNYDSQCVDILAPGRDIMSTIPGELMGTKSGTSMAAPAVAAAAALAYCAGHDDYFDIKFNILECADKYPALASQVKEGNVLNFDFNCLTPVEEISDIQELSFTVYPNPTSGLLFINNAVKMQNVNIQIYTPTGQTIFSEKIKDWNANESQQIDIENIATGIYFLSIQQNQKTSTFKIIKIK